MITNLRPRQDELVLALMKKDAYLHKVCLPKIMVHETHISWIFLTGLYAYKIKKQVKFGKILDFSTLKLRRKFCQREIEVNKALCGDMYKGVIKVVSRNSSVRVANLSCKGRALEYAVKMREIPQEYRMDNLIKADKVSLKTIEKLARILVKFHFSARTGPKIKSYGRLVSIRKKVDENFQTFGKLNNEMSGHKLSKIHKVHKELISFITSNRKLLDQRIRHGKIREIHGDLYLGNIFIVNDKRFYLYDRIEFNDVLRYADVAEDVSHLSMDLDYNNREDLRKYFVSQYVEKANDIKLKDILYFLMCYKAYIRAKVSLFRAKNETDRQKRSSHIKESKDFLGLAGSYLKSF